MAAFSPYRAQRLKKWTFYFSDRAGLSLSERKGGMGGMLNVDK